jgi:hypothetical protein
MNKNYYTTQSDEVINLSHISYVSSVTICEENTSYFFVALNSGSHLRFVDTGFDKVIKTSALGFYEVPTTEREQLLRALAAL